MSQNCNQKTIILIRFAKLKTNTTRKGFSAVIKMKNKEYHRVRTIQNPIDICRNRQNQYLQQRYT